MPCCSAACCCLCGPEGCPNIMGFPYMHVGVIGVGDRKKKRPKKTELVFRFRFLGATEKPTKKSRKNRLKKVSFRSGKTDKNRPKKKTCGFRFTTLRVGGTRVIRNDLRAHIFLVWICTTYVDPAQPSHNGRSGTRRYRSRSIWSIWSRSWSIWSIRPTLTAPKKIGDLFRFTFLPGAPDIRRPPTHTSWRHLRIPT